MAKTRTVRSTLTSRSQFVTDLFPSEGVFGWILRSPVPKGTLQKIDPPSFPEGSGILLPRDVPGDLNLMVFQDKFPLMTGEVIEFLGQPLGLVYAPTEVEARSFAEATVLSIDPPNDASLRPIELGPNTLFAFDELMWDTPDGSEALEADDPNPGDPDEEALEREVTSTFFLDTQSLQVQEAVMAIARWKEKDLEVLVPAIWPHGISANVARLLKMKTGAVQVHATIPGMYHDRLLVDSLVISCFAALLAHKTKNTASVSFGHDEQILYGTQQAPISCTHSLTLVPSLGLRSMDIRIQIDQGAFPLFTREIMNQALGSANPGYRCPKGKVRVEIHRTSGVPRSVSHGFLSGQIQSITEIQVNRVAHILNEDPLALRLGLIDTSRKPGGEKVLPLLSTLGGISDYGRKFSSFEVLRRRGTDSPRQPSVRRFMPLRGIGAALGFQGNGFSKSTEQSIKSKISLRMNQDGSVQLFAGTTPGSSAVKSHLRDLVRDTLEVKDEMIFLFPSETAQMPDAGPTSVSRSISIIRGLTLQACESIQKLRFRNPLPIVVEKSFSPSRSFTLTSPGGYPWIKPSWASAAVEVQVDPVTYRASVTGIWVVVQAGSILNFAQARAHVEGTVIQAVNWVLRGLHRTPKIEIHFIDDHGVALVERKSSTHDLQPLGLGELAQAVVPPALASALSQATGQFFDQIPITPEVIHRYMEVPGP